MTIEIRQTLDFEGELPEGMTPADVQAALDEGVQPEELGFDCTSDEVEVL